MEEAIHFSWFQLIPGLGDGSALPFLGEGGRAEAHVIPASWLVCLILVGMALVARRGLERARARGGVDALVPPRNFGVRNLMEIYTSAIFNLVESTMGKKDARRFFPLLATLFIYILFSNMLALLPGFQPPTASISNNLSMALIVFLVFNVAGLMRQKGAYVKHLFGPILFLAPFLFLVEVVGLFVRPVSLSLRLGGNLFGDHMVFGIMSGLVPPLVPVPFLGLGLFVSFIQALVFTLLSTVYIALAVAHGDEH